MGAAPSTPRLGEAGAAPPGAAEQMFAALVGDRAYPISSEFWRQLLELPLTLQWPRERVLQACHAFVLMSTQLCSGPSPEAKDLHPFIDAAMVQDSPIVASVVQKLLLNFVTRPQIPLNVSHPVFSDDGGPGVLQRVGSAAANFVLLPYYTFNYLVSASAEGATSQLADNSLLVLLILIHYRKCISMNESIPTNNIYVSDSSTNVKDAPALI